MFEISDLKAKKLPELQQIAKDLKVPKYKTLKKLDLVYQRGNIRAWFLAYADFLCQWKPLYYDAKIGVSVGASYTLRIGVTIGRRFIGVTKTFSISLKAQLHLYGPPTDSPDFRSNHPRSRPCPPWRAARYPQRQASRRRSETSPCQLQCPWLWIDPLRAGCGHDLLPR